MTERTTPYPEGRQVFVTWVAAGVTRVIVGEVYTAGPGVQPGSTSFDLRVHKKIRISEASQVLLEAARRGKRYIHPVKWLRPADEDPDQVEIETEQEVTA